MNTQNHTHVKVDGVSYRQQFRKCKKDCHCNDGQGHGPYWYSYDGRSAAKYVGMKLPDQVLKHLELIKSSKAKIKKVRSEIEKQRDDAYRKYQRACSQLRALDLLDEGERVEPGALAAIGLGHLNGHA